MKFSIIIHLIIFFLIIIGCNNELEYQPKIIFEKPSILDEIVNSLELQKYVEASNAKLLFSNSESDKYYILFYNSTFYDSSVFAKESYLKSIKGQKLLARYDSARVSLKHQKQHFDFPIEFTGDYDIQQKSFFYNIDSQAFTTIDLEYQILKEDTSYYLSEEQAQSILEEGLEYQKSQARIFKDMYLPDKFIEDVYYSHKHPRIKQNNSQVIETLDFSKIIVSRLYKIPVEENALSAFDEGLTKMEMSFNYTGNIIDDYAEVTNLEIKVRDYKNNIVFSKRY